MNTESNTHEQLWDLIKDIKFSMFTTRDAHGHLHSRPMTTQNKKLVTIHVAKGSGILFRKAEISAWKTLRPCLRRVER